MCSSPGRCPALSAAKRPRMEHFGMPIKDAVGYLLLGLLLLLHGVLPVVCFYFLFKRARKFDGVRLSLRTLAVATLVMGILGGIAVMIGANSGASGSDVVRWFLSVFIPLVIWGLCGILFRSIQRRSLIVTSGDVVVGLFCGLVAWMFVIFLFCLWAVVFGALAGAFCE